MKNNNDNKVVENRSTVNHREYAIELFKQGYNCSQAVIGAFVDELPVDREDIMKLASSFGGGMGRLREVCGAVSGAFMACGLKYGYSEPCTNEEKAAHYARIQEFAARFKEMNGSIVCRELLGLMDKEEISHIPTPRTEEFYKKRPCIKIIGDAAELFEKMLEENSKGE